MTLYIPNADLLNAYVLTKYILRELNLAIYEKAGSISDLFTEWEIILLLSSRCITWGVKNAKFESVSVLTD